MTKLQLAEAIERHLLYQPYFCNSKNYYRYNSDREIRELMKMTKPELQDMYDSGYNYDGRELQLHEMP